MSILAELEIVLGLTFRWTYLNNVGYTDETLLTLNGDCKQRCKKGNFNLVIKPEKAGSVVLNRINW